MTTVTIPKRENLESIEEIVVEATYGTTRKEKIGREEGASLGKGEEKDGDGRMDGTLD